MVSDLINRGVSPFCPRCGNPNYVYSVNDYDAPPPGRVVGVSA